MKTLKSKFAIAGLSALFLIATLLFFNSCEKNIDNTVPGSSETEKIGFNDLNVTFNEGELQGKVKEIIDLIHQANNYSEEEYYDKYSKLYSSLSYDEFEIYNKKVLQPIEYKLLKRFGMEKIDAKRESVISAQNRSKLNYECQKRFNKSMSAMNKDESKTFIDSEDVNLEGRSLDGSMVKERSGCDPITVTGKWEYTTNKCTFCFSNVEFNTHGGVTHCKSVHSTIETNKDWWGKDRDVVRFPKNKYTSIRYETWFLFWDLIPVVGEWFNNSLNFNIMYRAADCNKSYVYVKGATLVHLNALAGSWSAYGDGGDYICNPGCGPSGGCLTSGPTTTLSLAAGKDISKFFSTEIQRSGLDIQKLYIDHANEIDAVFNSDLPEYKNAQKALDDFIAVNTELLENGFSAHSDLQVESQHIAAADKLLTELSLVVKSPKLKSNILQIKGALLILKGKQVKAALKTFDQLKLQLDK